MEVQAARFQRDERAHAVAGDHRRRHPGKAGYGAGGGHRFAQPARHLLDALQRRSCAAPVGRQVHRQHRVAMMGEVAGLQRPDGMVMLRAVTSTIRGCPSTSGLPPV
jgi:hypothetical protein